MEMPPENTSSQSLREIYGSFHRSALGAEPACADILADFAAHDDALDLAYRAAGAATQAANAAEALRTAAEVQVEHLITRVELSLLGAVRKKRDQDPYKTAFPRGLPGATKPKASLQVDEASRIADYVVPRARTEGTPPPPPPAGVPDETLPLVAQLRAAIEVLATRCRTESLARQAEDAAFLAELAERRRWREQYRKDHGLLTAIYGTDKKKIESFFKKPGGRRKKGDTEPPTP